MKKAFKESKWYWYIPIISLYFLKDMVKWVFSPDNYIERQYRDIVVTCTIPIHVFSFLCIFHIIGII